MEMNGETEIRKGEDLINTCSRIEDVFNREIQRLISETEQIKNENDEIEKFLLNVLGIEKENKYTNCIYDALFGKSAKQIREEFGIDRKENIRDHLTEEELKQVQSMECLVSGLVACGWDYNQVKSFIRENNTRRLLP